MRICLQAALTGIDLRYFPPAPDLAALVSAYYLFRADITRVADLMRADLGQIRFMLRGHGHYMFGDQIMETPEVCLLGPSTAATRFDVSGPLLVFGVGLHPAGWAALVRDDASTHADRASNAVGRFGPLMEDALDAMRAAPDAAAMVGIADVTIRALTAQAAPPPLAFTRTTDAWLTGALDPSVDALVASLGVSARQVERLTKRVYGAPPKLLARKYRSLRAASLIGTGDLHWTEAVGDAFFDQSHFIRDFKRFTGLTPTRFQNDPPPITRLTLQRRRIVDNIAPLARIS